MFFFVAICCSTVFGFLIVKAACKQPEPDRLSVRILIGTGLLLTFWMTWLFMFLNVLLVGLVVSACMVFRAGRRTVTAAVVIASAVVFLIVGVVFTQVVPSEVAEKRLRNPIQPLDDRLAYENRHTNRSRMVSSNPATMNRLSHLESRLGYDETSRVRELRRAHQSYVTHFVNSEGFGFGRMISSHPNSAFNTVGQSITRTVGAWPAGASTSSGATNEAIPLLKDYEDPIVLLEYRDPWQQASGEISTWIPQREVFDGLHLNGLVDFVDRDSLGYVAGWRRAAGFNAHGFHQMPRLEGSGANQERWVIARLDLVSMLKHAEPVAYVSEELPRMDQLRKAPTRPLDELEMTMLAELQQGEDLQLLLARDRIRMMGSIRAAKQCLECHEVPRGALLGAFSYKLRRE
jgi:hypothetical protein